MNEEYYNNNIRTKFALELIDLEPKELIELQRFIKQLYFCYQKDSKSIDYQDLHYCVSGKLSIFKKIIFNKYIHIVKANPVIKKFQDCYGIEDLLLYTICTRNYHNVYYDFVEYLIENYAKKDKIKENLENLLRLDIFHINFYNDHQKINKQANYIGHLTANLSYSDGEVSYEYSLVNGKEFTAYYQNPNYVIDCSKNVNISRNIINCYNLTFDKETLPSYQELNDLNVLPQDIDTNVLARRDEYIIAIRRLKDTSNDLQKAMQHIEKLYKHNIFYSFPLLRISFKIFIILL